MRSSFIHLLWIAIVLGSLQVSHQLSQFYINNLYTGPSMDGGESNPFKSIDEAFKYVEDNIENFHDLVFIFTLIATNTTYYWSNPSSLVYSKMIALTISGANQSSERFGQDDDWCESLARLYIRADYEMTFPSSTSLRFEFMTLILQPGASNKLENNTQAAILSNSSEISFNMSCFVGNSTAEGKPIIQLKIFDSDLLSMTNLIFQNVSTAATFIVSESMLQMNSVILKGSQLPFEIDTSPIVQIFGSSPDKPFNINITNLSLNFSTQGLFNNYLPSLFSIDQYHNISVLNFSLVNHEVKFDRK